MKYFFLPLRRVLVVLVVLACLAAGSSGRTPAAESIPETVEPVVVDGVLDEPVWQIAKPVEVDYLGSKQGQKSAEKRMVARYAWDGNYLYIGYETFDANLLALGNGRTEGPEGNRRPGASIYDPATKVDVVEFFISFGDERFMWEIHHNALNQFNDVFCIVPAPEWPVAKGTLTTHGIMFLDAEWLRDDPPHTVTHAVKLKPKADGAASTPNQPGDADTGYTAEIRIPWRALGVPTAAETWRQENGSRVPGPWKLEGQKVSLLAVVQDGDLPERYHHSGPKRKPGWFHKDQPDWPEYEFTPAERAAVVTAIEELLADDGTGRPSSVTVDSLQPAGVAAALAAAGFLDESKPAQAEMLCEIIAEAAKCRRMHREILRLYQPAAFALFHAADAAEAQKKLAVGLGWKAWPRSLPDAVIRAAPLPTIDWLNAQAAATDPDLAKLRLMFSALGWWLRAESERQHAGGFQAALAAASDNPAIAGDPATAAALLKLVGDARAVAAGDWVIRMLESPDEEVRQAAATAVGRIAAEGRPGSPLAPVELRSGALAAWLVRVRSEQSPVVLARLAQAAEAWPRSPEVGQSLLELFSRSTDAEVQRSILFAAAKSQWPVRQALILAALKGSSGSVLGVALDAAAAHPDASYLPAIRELLAEEPDPSPQLIDAIGAVGDSQAVGQLVAWLDREKNPALRMKLIMAINRIPGETSGRVLSDLLAKAAEPLQADLLCRIAGQRSLPGAARFLGSLAEDVTAPVAVRGQAIWALGNYADDEARDSLRRLTADTARYFPDLGAERLVSEPLEQARLFIDLARLRQGDKAAEADVIRRFQSATPANRVAVLRSLAQIRLDSPLIVAGLKSGDFAVLEAAVRAARAAAPAKYAADFAALRQSPFIAALLTSGLDTYQLPAALDGAIEAGKGAAATP
jgi:HEAT repeat protein